MVLSVVPIVMIVAGGFVFFVAKESHLSKVGEWIMVAGLFAFAFANLAGKVVAL